MKWQLHLGGVARQGRPLSGEAVRVAHRELLEAGPDATAQGAAIERLMRLAFPIAWGNLWHGDPVRQLMRSPFRDRLVAEFLRVPPERVEPVREMDDWDRLEAMQTIPPEESGGPKVTLAVVCRIVEREYGAGWYYCPDRWPTADGYAPLDVVWRAWATLQMTRAFERLNMVRAIGITKSAERASALYDADVREALGG